MKPKNSITLSKHIFFGFLISWLSAVSIGIIFSARIIGTNSITDLWTMAVIQVAVIFSSIVSVLFTPLVIWRFRSYGVIKLICLLWLAIVFWILILFPVTHSDGIVLGGALLLSIAGLVGIRFLDQRR
jgi:hypothetical protein